MSHEEWCIYSRFHHIAPVKCNTAFIWQKRRADSSGGLSIPIVYPYHAIVRGVARINFCWHCVCEVPYEPPGRVGHLRSYHVITSSVYIQLNKQWQHVFYLFCTLPKRFGGFETRWKEIKTPFDVIHDLYQTTHVIVSWSFQDSCDWLKDFTRPHQLCCKIIVLK